MVKPVNKVLVSIPQAFEEEITTDSGIKFYKDPSYSKEWNAAVTGTVSVMSDLVSEESRPIFDQLDLGMEVAFDYKVCADFEYVSDESHFHQVTPENINHIRKYNNKRGEWLSVRSFPNPKGVVANKIFSITGENTKAVQEKTWVGWLQDKYMNILDGVQGDENRLEQWLANFTFGKTDKYYFRNKIYVEKQPYWVCDYNQIIAKKVQGQWDAVGDYLICAPLLVDLSQKVSLSAGGLHIPESAIQLKFRDRAILLHENKKMGLQKHDVISFEEKYIYPNTIEGVEYIFIKKDKVNGIYPIN